MPLPTPPKVCFVMTDTVRRYAETIRIELVGMESCGDSDWTPPVTRSDTSDPPPAPWEIVIPSSAPLTVPSADPSAAPSSAPSTAPPAVPSQRVKLVRVE